MSSNQASFESIQFLRSCENGSQIEANILARLNVDLASIMERGIYIFGAGRLGQRLFEFLDKNDIPFRGFVDNNKNLHGKQLGSTPIQAPHTLDADSIVYVASETYLNPIQQQLRASGVNWIITHLQGSILFKSYEGFPIAAYLKDFTEDLIENKGMYLEVFSLLKDPQSKSVFDNLVLYRLTGDVKYIDNVSLPSSLEYFDSSVVTLGPSEVYYDCGGFDGDSAQNFLKFTNNKYRSIHIFEPDQGLLEKARKKLEGHSNIVFNALGIYDQTAELKFDSTGGLDGVIDSGGNIVIQTISLDEYKSEDIPTYIKLDIEGVEIEALNGARQTISKYHPKLAIASYHVPRHLWEVPLTVIKLNPRYNLKLRHYTNHMLGSTYYFLPT